MVSPKWSGLGWPESGEHGQIWRMACLDHSWRKSTHEDATTLYFDGDFMPIGSRRFAGKEDGVSPDWSLVMGDMLVFGARFLILQHNHPSGDPSPSMSDIVVTRSLCAMLRPLRLKLIDHVIWAGDRHYSFRANGLM
ncbi:JAB domain-containing protein [Sphingobium aquiterrae]|uniref:JAB domain-containing protein n=1 Tax=Sphingobium aquiterrae TaxID=2038656 RepID=UPI00301A32E9